MDLSSNDVDLFHELLIRPNGKFVSGNELVLLVDALRIHLKQYYDPITVIASGRIDPLPHQLEAFHFLMSREHDSIRILLADDVGLGKTITAGLMIKEMLLRGSAKRILIVPPASLVLQWQREMKEKFGEEFKIAEGQEGTTILETEPLVISSLQYLRREERQEDLREVPSWDFVIFDEAHRLTAPRSNELARFLSNTSRHVLLLTATPHDGYTEHFVEILRLLDPTISDDSSAIRDAVRRLVLRRLKNIVTDFENNYLFPNTPLSNQVRIFWDQDELDFYRAAEHYVLNYYLNPETLRQYQNIIFILLVLMRRLSSSLSSGIVSLKRRLQRIEQAILGTLDEEDIITPISPAKLLQMYENAIEEEDDEKRERVFDYLIQDMDRAPSSLELEKGVLKDLIEFGERLLAKQQDSKTEALLKLLEDIRQERPNDKIIIFTEFVDTLRFLEESFKDKYKVYKIHGGKGMDKAAKLAQEQGFRKDGDILLGTEAAGEGLNLQVANIVINYELPWNPNRLQQRIGRVYRYGQDPEKPILVFNFVSTFRIEQVVLAKLYEKLEIIRRDLGESAVELLGTTITHGEINQLFRVAIENLQQAEYMLDDLFQEKIDLIKKITNNYLVACNLGQLVVMDLPINELVTSYDLERFILLCLTHWNVNVEEREGVYRLITFSLQPVSNLTHQLSVNPFLPVKSRKTLPSHMKFYFRPDIDVQGAEFIGAGHPLLDTCLAQTLDSLHLSPEGRLKTIPLFEGDELALLLVFTAMMVNESDEILYQEPILALIPEKGEPAWYHALTAWKFQELAIVKPPENNYDEITKYMEQAEEMFPKVSSLALPKVEQGFSLLKNYERIERQVRLQKVDALIRKTEVEIAQAQASSSTYRLPGLLARLERHQKEGMEGLDAITQRYSSLQVKLHGPVAMGLIIPPLSTGMSLRDPTLRSADYEASQKAKKIVEEAAMQYVMKYEQEEGRVPIDVSKEFEKGYDIESTISGKGIIGKRRLIEVKGLKAEGNPKVTSNEWRVASIKPREYFLYVVSQALSASPNLFVVPDPYKNLKNHVTKKPVISYVYEVEQTALHPYQIQR